ncbi:MAG: VOC family protein [Bacteroidota bacterium]
MQQLDHIVYAVPNLEESMNWFEAKAGIRPVFGGYHTNQGTKNALLKLGEQCYLELLAVDEENTAIAAPRWMGIDLITQPKITRWAVRPADLQKGSEVLKSYHAEMGNITGGQRKMTNGKLLTWELTMPLAEPEVEILPFLLNWERSESHPADSLKDHCTLVKFQLIHPTPESIQSVLKKLEINLPVVKGESVNISLQMNTPKGILSL